MAAPGTAQFVEHSVYRESDAEEITKLMARAFAEREPLARAGGLTVDDFEELMRLLTPRQASAGLTVVARSRETGEMVGAALTEDSTWPMAPGLDRLPAKFDSIFDILGKLEAGYEAGHHRRPGESLHLFLLGVSERFVGLGIAGELVARCAANGASKGFEVVVTEATNPVSQSVFRRQGFVERVRESYGAYRFGGDAVFASIADRGGPMLMDKRL